MSGFEIAGVVLGSIPLIISALEHYSDGVATIQSMRKYETVFEYLHASFVTALAIYRNSLEEILSPLALSDLQLYQLLEVADERAWDEAELVSSLRSRLGNNYLPFKSSIKQLNKKLVLFGHKLQLSDNFTPTWMSDNGDVNKLAREAFFRNPLNRIRGGFKSDKFKQLLSSLQDDIDRIASLTSGAISLEPLRLDRKRKANAAYWTRFQRHAKYLHESLHSRWSSQCACQCLHEASLRIEPRKGELDCAATFNVLFSFDPKRTGSKVPWNWRAVEIEPSDDLVKSLNQQHTTSAPQIIVHTNSNPRGSWTHCVQAAPKIKDLCKVLEDIPGASCCIGVLDDSFIKHHVHEAVLSKSQIQMQNRATLEEIIQQQGGKGLQIKDKCSLALGLANAVLQLHDTPWLAETWSLSDILLSHDQNTLSADHPYVSKSFTGVAYGTSTSVKRVRIIKNATVFALGVALLEISHGKELKSFETPDDLDDQGNRNLWTDYLIADRLVENIHERELPNFANAVRRCIRCSFECTVYSLDDDDFRERFYQGVVVPLQQDHDYAMGTVSS